MNFKKKETILGWLSFLIAAVTYVMTMEKTGSLWDCGEFLSCTYKLQVAHPPGAPFYMMVGKLFSLLAMGDTTKVAMMINLVSALSGAFCTYFFFHSASMLMRIVLKTNEEERESSAGNFILIASFIAANAATFLDSMWFNAIEGEVYAFSIFFTTLNVWAILKWYLDETETADYWLLLIALCTGMSIGVHLLSLLVFPFMGLMIYYKKFKESKFGTFLAFIAGVIMIFFVMKIVLSLTSLFLGRMDLLFVNTFKLPFFSGAIFGIISIIGLFYILIKKTHHQRNFKYWSESKTKFSLNTVILIIAFLFMGYLSNIMVVIRANANTPINMNVPNNFMTMKSYIDREQYGERPLVRGPQYPDVGEVIDYEEKSDVYIRNDKTKQYEKVGTNFGYVYSPSVKKLLPRMGHEGEDKKAFYRMWNQPKSEIIDRATGQSVQTFEEGQWQQAEQAAANMNQKAQPGQYVVKDKITFFDNISYMFNYQFGFMYFRYLLWNTAGRVDDLQGRANNDYGRWTSGIGFVDNFIKKGWGWGNVGMDQTNKPATMESKAHNRFYMIPFLLCVLGMIFTYRRDRKTFFALFVLFFTTGILQLIQSNEPPVEPRERDYAVSPSFWAFVLWLPFGIYWLFDLLKDKISAKPAMIASLAIGAAAPLLMGTQGWDDHNRGNRTSTLDFAVNMLESCPQNAILFCYGDNDTYPLWYAQEVEGIRPDIRVINTSLIEGDAYISQLRLPMNQSKAVKLSFTQDQVSGERRSYMRLNPSNPLAGDTLSLREVMDFLGSDDPKTKMPLNNGKTENFIPTTHVYIDIDPAKAIASKFLVTKEKMDKIPNRIKFEIPGALTKGALIQLDVILNNLYDRPICFASSNPSVTGLGIKDFLQNEGMVIKFTPTGSPDPITGMEALNSDDMYAKVMKYKFGKIKENNILLDEHTLMSYNSGMKPAIANLAMYYAIKGSADTVNRLLDHLYTNIPVTRIPYSYIDVPALQAATISKNAKYTKLISEGLYKNCTDVLDWLTSGSNAKHFSGGTDEVRANLSTLNSVKEVMQRAGDQAMVKRIDEKFKFYESFLGEPLR